LAILKPRLAVARERLAQESLSLGRLSGTQPGAEPRRLLRLKMGLFAKDAEKPNELAADFLEHFLVAARYRIASARECCARIDRPKHGLARHFSVQPGTDAPEGTRYGLESDRNFVGEIKAFLEASDQILLANGLSGLLGGPCRKRAPVGGVAGKTGDRLRDFVVALGNLQIAQDRIAEPGDPVYFVNARCRHRSSFELKAPSIIEPLPLADA
jgi:hypothetical protein